MSQGSNNKEDAFSRQFLCLDFVYHRCASQRTNNQQPTLPSLSLSPFLCSVHPCNKRVVRPSSIPNFPPPPVPSASAGTHFTTDLNIPMACLVNILIPLRYRVTHNVDSNLLMTSKPKSSVLVLGLGCLILGFYCTSKKLLVKLHLLVKLELHSKKDLA